MVIVLQSDCSIRVFYWHCDIIDSISYGDIKTAALVSITAVVNSYSYNVSHCIQSLYAETT